MAGPITSDQSGRTGIPFSGVAVGSAAAAAVTTTTTTTTTTTSSSSSFLHLAFSPVTMTTSEDTLVL